MAKPQFDKKLDTKSIPAYMSNSDFVRFVQNLLRTVSNHLLHDYTSVPRHDVDFFKKSFNAFKALVNEKLLDQQTIDFKGKSQPLSKEALWQLALELLANDRGFSKELTDTPTFYVYDDFPDTVATLQEFANAQKIEVTVVGLEYKYPSQGSVQEAFDQYIRTVQAMQAKLQCVNIVVLLLNKFISSADYSVVSDITQALLTIQHHHKETLFKLSVLLGTDASKEVIKKMLQSTFVVSPSSGARMATSHHLTPYQELPGRFSVEIDENFEADIARKLKEL